MNKSIQNNKQISLLHFFEGSMILMMDYKNYNLYSIIEFKYENKPPRINDLLFI